jgi:cytochrome c oxidase subunit 4
MSHIAPKSLYYTIFGSLMVLTAVTVAVAFLQLGALNFPVAIGIAVTKATLVILFFMHVKYGCVLFFMATLLGMLMTDYGSRGWYASPRGSATAGTPSAMEQPSAPAGSAGESAPGGAFAH